MKKVRFLHMLFVSIIATIAILIWWGIGYGVAWILEAGLNIDVNKRVFVTAGLIVGVIEAGIVLINGLLQNQLIKKRR